MVHRIALTKARINLGQLVRRVYVQNEKFILEKDGIPVACLVSMDELDDARELRDPLVAAQITNSNTDIRAGRTRDVQEFVRELSVKTRKKKR